jgi:bacteriorhodopsin
MKAVEDISEQNSEENAQAQVEANSRIIEICITRNFIIYISFIYIRSNYQAVSSSVIFYNFPLINIYYIFAYFGVQCKHKQSS